MRTKRTKRTQRTQDPRTSTSLKQPASLTQMPPHPRSARLWGRLSTRQTQPLLAPLLRCFFLFSFGFC